MLFAVVCRYEGVGAMLSKGPVQKPTLAYLEALPFQGE